MKHLVTDRNLVRQYLLGKLDEQTELENTLSEDILFNDEMMEVIDEIEEEIIEEYLDGSLVSADRNAVDKYFLQAPERKEKLRFARLLRTYCERKPDHSFRTNHQHLMMPLATRASHFRSYTSIAALLLIGISSLVYVLELRRSEVRLKHELAEERAHIVSGAKQAELVEPTMIPLTLVADRSRGAGVKNPQVEIRSSTQRIIVDIALQAGASGSYDVRLEPRGGRGAFWSARLLPLMSPTGDARLVFDLPTRGIESNVYSFVVSSAVPGLGGPKHYDFEVKLAK